MAMSGIKLADQLKSDLQDFKLQKLGKRYLKLGLDEDQKELVVTKYGPDLEVDTEEQSRQKFGELMSELDPKQPCFIIYDFPVYPASDSNKSPIKKSGLIYWCMDSQAPIKLKTLYSTLLKTVKDEANVNNMKYDFFDPDSFTYDDIIADMKKKMS